MNSHTDTSPRRSRRPSPALAVAIVALIVGTSGTAVAASGVLITSTKQIKNGAVSAVDLSKNARKSLSAKPGTPGRPGATGATGVAGGVGPTGSTGATGKDGQDAPFPETYMDFATIDMQGTTPVLDRGYGAVKVERVGAGIVTVTFSADVSDCTWLASGGDSHAATSAQTTVTVEGHAPNGVGAKQLDVRIFNSAGAPTDGEDFKVAALCRQPI